MTDPKKPSQDPSERLAALSPAKRALLQKLLEEKVPRKPTSSVSQRPAAIAPRPPGESPMLSHGQKRLWFLDQLEGASATYQMGGALRLEGALDSSALQCALVSIVGRHEVLRTRIIAQGGEPVPVVSPEIACPLPVISLESMPVDQREAEVQRLATAHLRRPFDLAKDALLRTTLVRVANDVHVLLLAVHHVMSDGWSIGVFFRELAALYAAFQRRETCDLPSLPIQYADYAWWQQRSLTRERLAPALAYWSDALRGAPPVLDLPFDRPRPPVQTFRGRTHRFSLDPRLERPIATLARECGATLFMVLLSAFGVVLSRYADQDDLVVGSPVANRPKKELEPLIGFFVNTLPLRIDLTGRPTVRELVARVRAMCLGAYAHQEVPFEILVEEQKPERNLSHSPLFQVMFALQNAQVDAEKLADLELSTFDPDTGTSMFDWTFFVQETKRGLAAAVEYNTDLFDEATVARFAAHYETVLRAMTSQPDRSISEFGLVGSEERPHALLGENDAAVRQASAEAREVVPSSVLAMFESAAAKWREKTAVQFEGESISYRGLHERVMCMAAYLRTRGVRHGDRVGIFLDRSLDVVVALLGTMAAGAAYVPLDPAYPRERLAFMLTDSGAGIVITESRLLPSLPACSAQVAVLDREAKHIALAKIVDWPAPTPANEAYVIYTSGSTGEPKGVAISHGALGHFLAAMAREPGLSEDDVLLSVTTISFDIAGLELYLPLSVGATVALVSRDVAADGHRLRGAIEQTKATVMQATPATWWALLVSGLSRGGLRKVLCGGEALPRELAQRLLGLGAEVWNLYGPTETTIWSAAYRVPSAFGDGPGPEFCPLGRPIANTQLHLLDRNGHRVPVGVTGELYIGGVGLAVRYLNRPALTAERYVPDPFGDHAGGRLYRTGDLARFRHDGTIEFLGRTDHQVKLRGHRIELGEIEAAVGQHPGVQASVVVCRHGGPEEKELVAYFVAKARADNGDAGNRQFDEQRASDWQKIWNDTYREEPRRAGELDLAGWKSSYTGEAVPEVEMQRWVDETVARILQLRPRRVLEIGCGTGLVLFGLLPHVATYVGIDASSVVVERLAARLKGDDKSRVRLACASAADLSSIDERDFDVVIINSVAQYFSSLAYLTGVLEKAATVLAPGGAVFLGDVRSLAHADLQHASVQFFRAAAAATSDEVRLAAARGLAREQELMLHPRAFAAIGEQLRFSSVETQLKRGRDRTEMTQFRYDVVLRGRQLDGEASGSNVGSLVARHVDGATLTARPLDDVRRLLSANPSPEALIVTDLVNARVADAVRVTQWFSGVSGEGTVSEFRGVLDREPSRGVEPEDIWALGESLGFATLVNWSATDPRGRFDGLFRRHADGGSVAGWPRFPTDDGTPLASDPLAARRERALIESVREHLETRLPAYMVPAQWVLLDAFPLTPNGKIDRRALRPPDEPTRTDVFVAPRTEDEQRLATIWEDALRRRPIGVTADFFDLGGHSLLATQIVSRVREAFKIELPLRCLFEARTVEGLAKELRARAGKEASAPMPIAALARVGEPAPLSFSQQRLWFLDRLEGPSATYNLFGSLRLRGALNVGAIEQALEALFARHDVLRTRFVEVDGKASQVASNERLAPLEMQRVDGDSVGAREQRARELVARFAHRPFDLAKGPLFRAALLEFDACDRVLVLAVHHIVADEWSIRILLRELSQFYQAFAGGKAHALAPLSLQYADYAAWQRQWLDGSVRTAQLDYWRTLLAGAPRSIALPTDRPRPPVQTFRGRTLPFELGRELSARVNEFSRAHGVTLFQTLLAAFATLLSRYAGERDVVVGTPIANRTRLEFEPLIGFFVNTLALRVDLRDDPTTQRLLERVRSTCLDAQERQDVPFESVVEELKVPRDLSRTPLFQAMFVLQNAPLSELDLGAVAAADFPIDSSIARFDLTLSVEDAGATLRGGFEFNTDLFDDVTIERFATHWRVLLEQMMTRAHLPVSKLGLLGDAEREQVLALSIGGPSANGGMVARDPAGHNVESAVTVSALFASQTRRTPNATAIVSAKETLSYAQLADRAEAQSARLRARGVRRGAIVGLYLDDPVEQLVGLLAILAAGGAYLPLDTRYPASRIAFMLSDSRAKFLLTTSKLADDLPASTCRVIHADGSTVRADGSTVRADETGAAPSLNESDGAWQLAASADDLAYVIYTSGSTGQPKGIGVSHAAIVRLARAQCALFDVTGESRILQFVSMSFDVAASDVVMALASGAALYACAAEVRTPGPALVEYLERHRISHLQVPASILASLPWRELPDLLALVVGGESSAWGVLDRWRKGRRLFSAYGPTETTVAATAGEMLASDTAVHLGRPIAGAHVYVLDEHLEPVPYGVAGEIYIGGEQLARGYVERPTLTAERFVPDPHIGIAGRRMYRTGDRARLMRDGRLEFVGRTDHQIKINGNRIELGEIEAALSSHASVARCAVVVRESRSGQRRLSAFAALRAGTTASGDELRKFLQDRLPSPFVPGAVTVLEELPLTHNGKVDREALSAIEVAVADSYIAPRTPAETTLANIWKDLLGARAVGIFDNFFALGGDSIISIQVVSRARQAGLVLTVKQLFQHQTVAELAAVARLSRVATETSEIVSGPVPLTPIQKWFFEGVSQNPHYFNQSMFVRAAAKLDAAVLGKALQHVTREHDMLRARFRSDGSIWSQRVDANAEDIALAVEVIDRPIDAGGRAIIEANAARCQTSLQLESGPLGRAILYRCAGDDADRLLLVLHHLVVDGISWRVLIEDLERAYVAIACGRVIEAEPKTTSFASWAARLGEHAVSAAVRAELPYWLDVSAADPAISLDAQIVRRELLTGDAMTVTKKLDGATTRALLVDTPAAYRTQINDVLVAALTRALASVFGLRRVRIDLEGHGREDLFDDVDVSRTVGWFTTVFPVVLAATASESVETSLCGAKESLRAIPHRGIHFGLLRFLGTEAVRSELAEFAPSELSFNYLGRFEPTKSGAIFQAEAEESAGAPWGPKERRRYLLEVNSWTSGGELHIATTYSPSAHRAATIDRLVAAVIAELEAIARHCGSPGVGGYTASDFPLARLDRGALEGLAAKFGRRVEDVYPVSPVQEGMLFHDLYEPASGAYCQQLVARLSGDVRPDALARAFAVAVERHPALRTSFLRGTSDPLQVVLAQVALPCSTLDLDALPVVEQQGSFEAFLDSDRRRGFDLGEAPLMRLTLARWEGASHLVLTHHHLLLDGWSLSIVLGEVQHAYEAFLRDESFVLPRPRPFRDYIAWLKRRETDSEGYWRAAMAGFSAPTRLGIEKTLSSTPSAAFATHERLLSPTASAALSDLARKARVTLGVVVQAAWSILLMRYSGEKDVVFGSTVSGRPASIENVESMVGLFIATVPVREAPDADLTVAEYLVGVQSRQLAREPHLHTPLVDIKTWSDVPASAPLFETLVVFENYPVSASAETAVAAMRISEVRAIEQTNYPLTLFASPGETLRLLVSFDRSRYDEASAARLLGHLENLLVAMSENPELALSRLSLLSEEERRELVRDANRTEREPRSDAMVHEAIAAQAASTPEAIALACADQVLTYHELEQRVRAMAARLAALGVSREVIVGLYLERSVDVVVALLAVLRAGGAYLPLDTEFPAERIAFMLRDSGARWVLTQSSLAGSLPSSEAGALCLDASPWPAPLVEPVARAIGDAQAAYVLYTSGSTGRPKGVTISHASLRNFIDSMAREPGMTADDVLLSVTTISFDIAGLELLLPLTVGARVEILPPGRSRNGSQLVAALAASEATVMQATPTTWRMLLEEGWDSLQLRRAFCGGEALPRALADALLERGLDLWNLYGPTETTIWSTVSHVEATTDAAVRDATCLIGRPIANTRVYILDAELDPVPVGVAGELFIGGAGVARGYLRRSGLTASRFLPDPFANQAGARMYRTGDRARYVKSGALEFLGRVDQQIKLRGHRIELGEIEAVLVQHPQIANAAVALRGEGADVDLVAFLIRRGDASSSAPTISSKELRSWLAERLPSSMVVATLVWVDELPLTLNGKIDRAKLPRVTHETAASVRVPPRTDTEVRLATIWKEVLGISEVGALDDFFELGGHSLRATRVAAQVRAAFRVALPLAYLFDHPTVREIAEEIDRLVGVAAAPQSEARDGEEEVTL